MKKGREEQYTEVYKGKEEADTQSSEICDVL